jgi:hypothetical protein
VAAFRCPEAAGAERRITVVLLSVAKARMRRAKMAAGIATALITLLAFAPNPFANEPVKAAAPAEIVAALR